METNVKKLELIDALKNFHQAFEKLASAWIASEADLSFKYPFEASFDEHAVDAWVKSSVALLEAQDSEFEGLDGRIYKTKFVYTVKQANDFIALRPEYGVLAEIESGIHLALLTDEGAVPPSRAAKYLKEVYGLEPGDVDLQPSDTVEDVDRIAKKYGLTKKAEMSVEKAAQVMKRFGAKPIIQVAPSQIIVDGHRVAESFDDFCVYCSLKGLRTADFQNWPFSKQIV